VGEEPVGLRGEVDPQDAEAILTRESRVTFHRMNDSSPLMSRDDGMNGCPFDRVVFLRSLS
jgi:hypothetical protein